MSDDISFFKIEKIFNFSVPVYSIKIANGIVVTVTKNILLRCNLSDPANTMEEFKLTTDDDLAHSLFLDPSGNHVIICMQSCQSFYLSKNSKKTRLLKEAKGCLINAVGWNIKQSNEFTTQNILLGTINGELIETKLTNSSTTCVEQYWNKIYEMEQAIMGILFDSYSDSNWYKYFLVITTPTSIYPLFINTPNVSKGNPIFHVEFEKISQMAGGAKCTTFPFDFGYSELDYFYNHEEQFPTYISWMNGVGIYWTTLQTNPSEAEGNIFSGAKLLNYSVSNQKFKPINIANTAFHIILQYANVIDIFCVIHDEVVHSFKYDLFGDEKFFGLSKDHSNGRIYMFTNHVLYRVNCDQETKNLWRTYAKLGKYDLAEKYCNNDEERKKIYLRHAEHLYEQQKYVEAGQRYAATSLTFEEVSLKFVDLKSKEGLKSYLMEYIFLHKATNKIKEISFDIVCMWLLEIFFEEINLEQFKTGKDITNDSYKRVHPDYKRFVEEPEIIKCFKRNKSLLYDKIKNYGDFYHSAILAEIIQDNIRIIEHCLEKGKIEEALKMLPNEKSPKYHYLFGSKIIQTHPNELVDIWIKISLRLDPKKLIPILHTIDDAIAIRYVEHMVYHGRKEVEKVHSSSVEELHNFYVLLCAKLAYKEKTELVSSNNTTQKTKTRRDDLMKYLINEGLNVIQIHYDPQLALRICLEWKHLQASVFLHCLLQKHREAVDLALSEKNVELAQEVALKFMGSDEVKKHLWLQIAKFMIEEHNNIEEVCTLVRSQHCLKLEDILPFFPDFVKIEDFSEAICDSLTEYNDHIENLKNDMKLANEYASKTRDEINYFKQRPILVPGDSKCDFCHELLTLKPFCLFPCRHFFHMQCLIEVATSIVIHNPNSEMGVLQERSECVGGVGFMQSTDNVQLKNNHSNSLSNEYYSLLTNDCCYCGSGTIDIIDKPIITFAEFDMEMQKWD